MNERLKQEIKMVKQKYNGVQSGENPDWLLIPSFPLPKDMYNKEHATILFNIPVGYPSTGPDDFFVDVDLQLRGGGNPPNFNPNSQASSGPAPIPGNWGWFSWHPQIWRPVATIEGGDNLLTFIRGVNMCLRGEGA